MELLFSVPLRPPSRRLPMKIFKKKGDYQVYKRVDNEFLIHYICLCMCCSFSKLKKEEEERKVIRTSGMQGGFILFQQHTHVCERTRHVLEGAVLSGF